MTGVQTCALPISQPASIAPSLPLYPPACLSTLHPGAVSLSSPQSVSIAPSLSLPRPPHTPLLPSLLNHNSHLEQAPIPTLHPPPFSAPLVDSNPIHNSSALLMLLSVVFVGLAAFFIYKFKRCVPLH